MTNPSLHRRFLIGALVLGAILTLAAVSAMQRGVSKEPPTINASTPGPEPAKSGAPPEAQPVSHSATPAIELEEFKSLLSRGVIVVDARSRTDFEQGHLLVETEPPVLNLPANEFNSVQVNRLMQAQQQTGYPIVLYCSSRECEDAEYLYRQLAPFGFQELKIYSAGWRGIQDAGLPTATGPDTWTEPKTLGGTPSEP